MNKYIHINPNDDSTTILAIPCKACGHHQTIAGALLKSKEWKLWYKHASKNMLYDVDETQELNLMSDMHWNDFIKFIYETKTNKRTTKKNKDKVQETKDE